MKLHPHLVEAVCTALIEIFERDFFADKVIEYHLKNHKKWGSRDRRFFAESVYDIVRWWRYLWFRTGHEPCTEREKVYELIAAWLHEKKITVPDWQEFASVQIVDPSEEDAISESFPDWLYDLGRDEVGESWPALATSLNLPAEVVLRVNTISTSREQLIARLKEEGVDTEPVEFCDTALKLIERKNVFRTESFKNGLFEVQDAVSQCVAPLLDVQPGQRVIDACAGAGGKSLNLATLMQNKGRVLALDIHEKKLQQCRLRARRNKISIIETRVISGSKTIKRLKQSADRLLLDVPCSGIGVIRRNPDTKWKLTPLKLKNVQAVQREILQKYPSMVKPGGKMVYATCSVLPSENEQVVEEFVKQSSEWELLSMKTWRPDVEGFDGFLRPFCSAAPDDEKYDGSLPCDTSRV